MPRLLSINQLEWNEWLHLSDVDRSDWLLWYFEPGATLTLWFDPRMCLFKHVSHVVVWLRIRHGKVNLFFLLDCTSKTVQEMISFAKEPNGEMNVSALKWNVRRRNGSEWLFRKIVSRWWVYCESLEAHNDSHDINKWRTKFTIKDRCVFFVSITKGTFSCCFMHIRIYFLFQRRGHFLSEGSPSMEGVLVLDGEI